MGLHIASLDDIKNKSVTDIYFQRAVQVLLAKDADTVVTAEFHCSSLPKGYSFGVFCGLEEVLTVLEGLPIDVDGMPEGSVFHPREPLMSITGPYSAFGELETAVLGLMCQASGVATKAARCKLAAGERPVVSFGARRMHPALAPMIERNAYIGGCDGFAVIRTAELVGIPATGTMPHALIIIAGDLATALRWFDEVVEEDAPRIALIDTFEDEKFGALVAAEALGGRLKAVRLDTPGSRRGDMLALLREVRWELDLRGHQHVQLFVSGGLDEFEILRLNELADGYGVGTAISNAPVVNLAMDIVAVGDRPVTKRGKASGRKQLLVCPSCRKRLVVPADRAGQHTTCDCGGPLTPLLEPLIRQGEVVTEKPSAQEIKQYCTDQVKTFVGESLPLGETGLAPKGSQAG